MPFKGWVHTKKGWMSGIDLQLCELVNTRLQGAKICALKGDNINIGSCENPHLQGQECPFYESCKYSDAHSFGFNGGYISVYTCQDDALQVALLITFGVIGIAAFAALLFILIIPHFLHRLDGARKLQRLEQKATGTKAVKMPPVLAKTAVPAMAPVNTTTF